ncbi:hypothetical protein [Candidatus Palauibacter sp.]|uniref:hypothetical protein n=1 Tax=Candidatus Palauibacter sp. TaxID=3101350 RepID=UPI003B5C64B7
MPAGTHALTRRPPPAFPAEEIERHLRIELEKIAADAAVMRPEWEPLLDSQRVVGTVLVLEDLLPACKIPPDKVVRKGGYNSVDEAINDMLGRIKRVVAALNRSKVLR